MVLGDTFKFLGVSVAGKIVPAAAIFLFSRMMPAADFGVLSLFLSYIWIAATLMSLNLYTGVGRIIFHPEVEPKSLIGTSLVMIGGIYALMWLVLVLTRQPLAQFLNLPAAVLLLIPVVVAGYVAESLITQILIFQRKSSLLLLMTGVRAIATIAIAVLLVIQLRDQKYMGVVIAESLSAVGFLTAFGFVLRKHVTFRFDRSYAVRLMQYSLPLIIYVLSLTLLSQSDRIMIDQFHGKTATGLYSLTYNFASLMLIGVTAVLNAFQSSFYSAMNDANMGRVLEDARTTMLISAAGAIVLVLLGEPISVLIFPAEYSDAFNILPIVAIGCVGLTSFQIWVRIMAFHNRTALISLVSVIAVTVNIALNYWTLGPFGYKAAAYTTLAAQYLMTLLCLAVLWRLQYLRSLQPVTDLVAATVLCCAALAVSKAFSDPTLNLTFRLAMAVLVAIALAAFGLPRMMQARQ